MIRHCQQCAERMPSDAHPAKLYCTIRCRDRAERARSKAREIATKSNRETGMRHELFAQVRNPSIASLAQLELDMLAQDKPILVENPPAGWIPRRTTEVFPQSDGSFLLTKWTPDVSDYAGMSAGKPADIQIITPIEPRVRPGLPTTTSADALEKLRAKRDAALENEEFDDESVPKAKPTKGGLL